ncbi:glyceraldehyde 3-phosphate dehydrogenase NAD-binding domain-containing protein [Loktanella sp. SALINAS62]|uniref:type I glyceraldehyde-3-phosphate dehydrogenase n=1 Tax=Loktanella sp. SALINAS62 TaxID=2706124 RepID=UPI001B8B8B94|nr:glyceraldehyde 3-phosphate dehydrogenase NAD-binding domain-containing protein [Loktanella sp. SALINAS62]MBS1301150.1 aldehyde dehydrogenase [Loktanella sp. SALINAS62]
MTRPIRIVINGFGRIGRTVLRQLLTDPCHGDIRIVAINDIAPLDACAYLFRYDSAFGPFPAPVTAQDGRLHVGDRSFDFWSCPDLRVRDLSGVDVVLECTGRAAARPVAQAGLDAGAAAVLISGPSPAADVTVVMGANDTALGDARIVSNASCTTNAIAPLLMALDTRLGIVRAHVTTIHCYTGSQPTIDLPGPSPERSRAAAVSMVPTTTSAASQITQVLPQFMDRLTVAAVRVPVHSVSAIDAVLQMETLPDGDPNDLLRAICADVSVIGLTDDPCVSTDMRARAESLVLALPQTMVTGDGQLRVFGWYDNEWGFSARMIAMMRQMHARPT